YHGVDGPMSVSFIPKPNRLCADFNRAMHGLGFPACEDFNVAEPEGYGYRQGTIVNGRRVSTASAYLRPSMSRSNLTVLSSTSTRRVLVENGRAVAVEIQAEEGIRQIKANRGIIVCAGAFHSPHILMNSGIGDSAALTEKGV